MNFEEAQQRFAELEARNRRSDITVQQYQNEVNQLRVQDQSGRWWQPDSSTGGWLVYDGSMWRPGILPLVQSPPLPFPPSPPVKVPPAPAAPGQYPPVKDPTVPPVYVPPQQPDDKKLMDTNTFREISRTTPWHKRPQKWWDLFSILGGVVVAVIWFLYSSASPRSEGLDLITPLLMVGIPFVLVTFRKDIDNLLVPIQHHRKRFSKLVLVGISIAMPFLTAFILYNVFRISQYPLMHWNLLIGSFVSYALVREPVLAKEYRPAVGRNLKIPLILLTFTSLCIAIVSADHCMNDPLNAQDCLRSSGFGEVIAGLGSEAIALLINLPEFILLQALINKDPELMQMLNLTPEEVQVIIQQLNDAFVADVNKHISEGNYVANYSTSTQAYRNFFLNPNFWRNPGWGQCEEFEARGQKWSQDFISRIAGDNVIRDNLFVEELSTTKTRDGTGGWGNWVDDFYKDNHIAPRVILPDGTRLMVDYWEAIGGKEEGQTPRILTEKEWIEKWKGKLGGEFNMQRSQNETRLKNLINKNGQDKGVDLFRQEMQKEKTPESKVEILIRSWRKEPW